jgi:hypothetical protein
VPTSSQGCLRFLKIRDHFQFPLGAALGTSFFGGGHDRKLAANAGVMGLAARDWCAIVPSSDTTDLCLCAKNSVSLSFGGECLGGDVFEFGEGLEGGESEAEAFGTGEAVGVGHETAAHVLKGVAF